MDKHYTAEYKGHVCEFWFAGGSDRECKHSIRFAMVEQYPGLNDKDVIIKRVK